MLLYKKKASTTLYLEKTTKSKTHNRYAGRGKPVQNNINKIMNKGSLSALTDHIITGAMCNVAGVAGSGLRHWAVPFLGKGLLFHSAIMNPTKIKQEIKEL